MSNNRRKTNFIVQGTILAGASIIVRIIGLLYRIPLTNILGDEGMGYYSFAFEPYSVMLLLSYYGLPTAVSKLVATRNGEGKYKNSYRVFQAGMMLTFIIGIITASFTFFGADFIAGTLNSQPMSALALKVLGPTLFVLSIMGILRGYFQGMGTMIPTAISQIIEQIVNAIVSIVAALYLFSYGSKVDSVLSTESYAEAYGAAGGTFGTLMGAVAGLLFLILVFAAYKSLLRRQIRRDRTRIKESYSDITKLLLITAAPIVLSSVIFNIGTTLDGAIFSNILSKKEGYTSETIASLWGIFTNKYKVLTTLPIAISTALSVAIVPNFSETMASGNKGRLVSKVHYAVRFAMLVAIPSAVGISVLAEPIISLLFTEYSMIDVNLLRYGTLSVVAYSLSTITNAILQGINQMRLPVIHAIISLLAHLFILVLLIGVFNTGIYGVTAAYILFAVFICILNARSITKHLSYKQEIIRTFLLPTLSSVIMGIGVYAVYTVLHSFTKSNILSTMVSVSVGIIIYVVLLLLFKCVQEDDLYSVPKGDKIVSIARKLHL
ncbi:MAG: polysaccharide biosynthesis protein, partial [Clostridiales bacterium]|nr:polysaccharide biosynthesis protein [Clostridiales bacterium]